MHNDKRNSEFDILDTLEILLKNEGIEGIEIVSSDNSEKGDGYMSDVRFIDIIGTTTNGEKRKYSLVLKTGIPDKTFREKLCARSFYENEIYLYNTVVPIFQNLLKDNHQQLFKNIAKCYSTILEEDKEYLALENLKKVGYDLHDKTICMDEKHRNLVLKAYAKWHAISFVLKDQNKRKFEEISSKLKHPQLETALSPYSERFFTEREFTISDMLENAGENELLKKFHSQYSPLFKNWITALASQEKESVIVHGDCWNNNFLFRYSPTDKLRENPLHVVMVDFQMAHNASPIMDLSYYLFATCSGKNMAQLREILNIYYEMLADNIRKMGSDPEILFPYTSLIEHWKKYRVFGLMMTTIIIPLILLDKEDAPDMEKRAKMTEENRKKLEQENMDKVRKRMTERLLPLVRHAVEYQL